MDNLEGKDVKFTIDRHQVIGQYEEIHLLGLEGTIVEANEDLVCFRPDSEEAQEQLGNWDTITWVPADVVDANHYMDKDYDGVDDMIGDWVEEN